MFFKGIFAWFVCFQLLCSFVEAGGWNRVRNSQLAKLCAAKSGSNSAIELHAFFDIRPRRKAFACLKVSTCNTKPVCFVTSHPRLRSKAVNDSTIIWQDLIRYIQTDRKIEPLYDNSMNNWKYARNKIINQYVQEPSVYRMCRGVMIYRFVAKDSIKRNSTIQANNSSVPLNSKNNTSKNTKKSSPKLDPISLCPLFTGKKKINRRRKSKSMRTKRVDRSRHNATSSNFMLCQGLDCPCVRICLRQGRKQKTFTDCLRFRIICTFSCDQGVGVFGSSSTPKSSKKSSGKKHNQKKIRKNRRRQRPKRKPKSKRRNRKKSGKKGK